jgi:hypothetical protein
MEFNLKSPPKEIENEINEFKEFLNELIPAKKTGQECADMYMEYQGFW